MKRYLVYFLISILFLSGLVPARTELKEGSRSSRLLVVEEGEHLTAEVTSLQTLGKEVYLKLQHGDHTLTACLSWDHDYQIGDILKLKIRKCHLFPASQKGGV